MSDSNGSNSRLNRIERLIEQAERANREAHARHEKAHARSEQAHARQDRETRLLKEQLRRWAALGVQEARNQRKRARQMEDGIAELKAAQLLTEKMLQQFLSSQRGNGHAQK